MVETDYLRASWLAQNVIQPNVFLIEARKRLELPAPKVTIMVTPMPEIPKLLETVHFKPSVFQLLDMPETNGTSESLNIVCKRS
jgi:hypothetical protein